MARTFLGPRKFVLGMDSRATDVKSERQGRGGKNGYFRDMSFSIFGNIMVCWDPLASLDEAI